jgi:hypothetical protein
MVVHAHHFSWNIDFKHTFSYYLFESLFFAKYSWRKSKFSLSIKSFIFPKYWYEKHKQRLDQYPFGILIFDKYLYET